MVIPGCTNGQLTDPQAYFFWLVQGTRARDYRTVLANIEPALNRYWIAVQHDSLGNVRPRLHLPTQGRLPQPSDTDWHNVDVEALPDPAWVWIDRGGPYTPAPCVCEGDPEPPSDDLEARVAALEARVARHLAP